MPRADLVMDKERFDIAKAVILSGWSLMLLSCLIVIGAAVYQDFIGSK
jgi:hypothetical protein